MENNNNGDTPDGEVEFTCNTLQCKCKYEFVEIDRGYSSLCGNLNK